MAYEFKHKMNPWRKGVDAGADYARAHASYVAQCKATHNWNAEGKPSAPSNPYPAPITRSRNAGARQWEAGFKWGLNREIAQLRQQQKGS
jgi:hypothetical protein